MHDLERLPRKQAPYYLAGFHARRRGEPLSANPDSPQSYEGILWDEGWSDADEMFGDDSTKNR